MHNEKKTLQYRKDIISDRIREIHNELEELYEELWNIKLQLFNLNKEDKG